MHRVRAICHGNGKLLQECQRGPAEGAFAHLHAGRVDEIDEDFVHQDQAGAGLLQHFSQVFGTGGRLVLVVLGDHPIEFAFLVPVELERQFAPKGAVVRGIDCRTHQTGDFRRRNLLEPCGIDQFLDWWQSANLVGFLEQVIHGHQRVRFAAAEGSLKLDHGLRFAAARKTLHDFDEQLRKPHGQVGLREKRAGVAVIDGSPPGHNLAQVGGEDRGIELSQPNVGVRLDDLPPGFKRAHGFPFSQCSAN